MYQVTLFTASTVYKRTVPYVPLCVGVRGWFRFVRGRFLSF